MTTDREPTMQTLADRLGLARDPFGETSGEFFFVGGQRRFLVQQAVHALYFAGGLVLLSGPDGAGKTRILDEVCTELGELVDVCRLDASVLMDIRAIRSQFADEFGLSVDVSADEPLLTALNQIAPEAGDPLPVLLAIDDAHELAVPVLTACYELARASAGRIRLLLVGAPELLTAWAQTGIVEGDQLDVLPLDAQETLDYVATRLQAAGYRGENPLTEAQQGELFRRSRGNIGAIHELAPGLLTDAIAGEPAADKRRGLPLPHLAIVAALLVMIGIAIVFFRGESHDAEPVASMPEPSTTAAGRQSVPLILPNLDAAPPATGSESPAPADPSATAPTQSGTSSPAPAADTARPELPKEPVAQAPAAQPVPQPKPEPAPKPAAKPKETPKAPEPVAVAKPATPPSTSGNGSGLAAMPKDQFVVQLMAATSKAKLNDFIARSAKGVKVHTYETRRDGRPWFVAVAGPFATKAAARSAIAELPKPLRDQSPWLRSVASVQSDLKAK